MQQPLMWRLFVSYKSIWYFTYLLFSPCENDSKADLNLIQDFMQSDLVIQWTPDVEGSKLIESLRVSTIAAPPRVWL